MVHVVHRTRKSLGHTGLRYDGGRNYGQHEEVETLLKHLNVKTDRHFIPTPDQTMSALRRR